MSSRVLVPGAVIDGRYTITKFLGAGGVAEVYKAQQRDLDIPVALKALKAEFSSRKQLLNQARRLRNEARAAARIQHPNVVRIRAVSHGMEVKFEGDTQTLPRPYMVMDFIEGRSLRDELEQSGPLHPTRALPLFLDCLDGLGEAHANGVVHKDLKPENIVLTRYGSREVMVILDFGTARAEILGPMTFDTSPPFTPNYIAPEYIQSNTVTPTLDVYQMGLILIEALTGAEAVPFDDPIQCIKAHVVGQLQIPGWLRESPLGPIVQSATALNHTHRIVNATIFRKVLSRIDPASIKPP